MTSPDFNFGNLKPVSRAEAASAPPDAPGLSAPVVADLSPAQAPAFRVQGGPARSRVVPLVYPIGDGETDIAAIVVRRMSVAEVRDWTAGVAADRRVHLPMFELTDGRPVPVGALDALDHDDWAALDAAATDFLPQALRGFLATDRASETGGASQP